MMGGAFMGVMLAQNNKLLPYEYQVEWVGCEKSTDGSRMSYVDTGIVVGSRNDLIFKIRVAFVEPYLYAQCFGGYLGESYESTRICCSNGRDNYIYTGYRCISYNQSTVEVNDIRKVHDYELYYNNIKVDGTIYRIYLPSGTSLPPGISVNLFGRNGGKYTAGTNIYSFSVQTTSGDELLDLIPVVANGSGCFYDRITKKLFRNLGNYPLTIGPRV